MHLKISYAKYRPFSPGGDWFLKYKRMPLHADIPSVTTTAAPEPTTMPSLPVTTTRTPTTEVPVTTTIPSVTTTAAPELTTMPSLPVTTTGAPTTEVPVTTTMPSVTTTAAPEPTTMPSLPVTTTGAPTTEVPVTTTMTTTTEIVCTLTNGVVLQDGCYTVSASMNIVTPWQLTTFICASYGGALAHIDDVTEAQTLANYIATTYPGECYTMKIESFHGAVFVGTDNMRCHHGHYDDVIMSTTASQITCVSIVCTNFCSGADQRKHQSSASLAFVRGIHRWPVDSPHKGPVTRKMFSFDDVIMDGKNNEFLSCKPCRHRVTQSGYHDNSHFSMSHYFGKSPFSVTDSKWDSVSVTTTRGPFIKMG